MNRWNPLRLLKGFVTDYLVPFFRCYPFRPPAMCTPGDFVLMHRDQWFALRGFQEISPASGMVYAASDGLLVYAALTSGLKQVYFYSPFAPMRIYSMPQDSEKFVIAGPNYIEEYHELYRRMIRERKPFICNGEQWGIGNVQLEEKTAP